ncbi:hypothetical protein PHYPO_G00162520 [Pangasianodon hypophthalmus]|uniref:CRIB domain-containing protein n=1 Tax=Pangasianodon hypophthalmus TaxID=310915 RepID=A0A5N5JTM1_PANHP|nr:hypothetical protein PHYPO_G00162520 [Pangasianodon hypophthalmus]
MGVLQFGFNAHSARAAQHRLRCSGCYFPHTAREEEISESRSQALQGGRHAGARAPGCWRLICSQDRSENPDRARARQNGVTEGMEFDLISISCASGSSSRLVFLSLCTVLRELSLCCSGGHSVATMSSKAPIYLKRRSRKGKKEKLRDLLSSDMISPPLGDFRHTIHIGSGAGGDNLFGDLLLPPGQVPPVTRASRPARGNPVELRCH